MGNEKGHCRKVWAILLLFCYEWSEVVVSRHCYVGWKWVEVKVICAEASEGCPRSPGVIAVKEWTPAGNWQASLCIRKLIALRFRVLCQLKSSSAGRWKRGQPHFCAAAVWRLASDCCRHRLYSANSHFDGFNHPHTAGRWIRKIFHPYQYHVFWCSQSMQC